MAKYQVVAHCFHFHLNFHQQLQHIFCTCIREHQIVRKDYGSIGYEKTFTKRQKWRKLKLNKIERKKSITFCLLSCRNYLKLYKENWEGSWRGHENFRKKVIYFGGSPSYVKSIIGKVGKVWKQYPISCFKRFPLKLYVKFKTNLEYFLSVNTTFTSTKLRKTPVFPRHWG